ncbi:MAG: hypothetical protein HW418_2182 [Anaerolineales bacterium]|nr:hypothetical protein [Anaerolineales bacterium]
MVRPDPARQLDDGLVREWVAKRQRRALHLEQAKQLVKDDRQHLGAGLGGAQRGADGGDGLQLALALLALGDIEQEALGEQSLACLVPALYAVVAKPQHAAIARDQPILLRGWPAGREMAGIFGHHPRAVVGINEAVPQVWVSMVLVGGVPQ